MTKITPSHNETPRLTQSNVVSMHDAKTSNARTTWCERIEQKILHIQRSGNTDTPPGSKAPTRKTYANAIETVRKLPKIIKEPVIAVNTDGTFLMEWHIVNADKSDIFTLIIDGDDIIYALLLESTHETHGAVFFSEDSIDSISNILLKHFEIQTYARTVRR